LNAGATVALRVNKSGAALSSDLIDLAGAMTYAGTLTVTHSGDALVAGDSFTLFDAPSYGGAFGTVNLPALGADLQWDYSGVTVDGSVVVFSTSLTLDGASGSTQHTNTYSTGGAQATGQGLHVELGFFVDYLIVAGGGGGGAPRNSISRAGGGGGAGGLLSGSAKMVGATNIVVGAGGAGTAIESSDRGSSGGNSSAFSQTAIGGGGGGHNTTSTGGSGGSGGGGGISTGGSGIDGQGYDGGDGDGTSNIAGGGGGAGGPGSAITGGTGTISSITGSSIEYARGGDGATAANKSDVTPPPGTANTGNGGKGVAQDTENSTPGGSGGSGIVVIRYPGASIPTAGGTITSFTGNGTIGENGVEYQVHSFTNVGADTFDISGLDLDARLGAEITTAISGEGDLVFNGPGTLTLSGDSTYTGDTIVSNGTLLVTGSLAAGSDVTVKSGASLGGSGGTISGNVTFETGSTFAANGTLTIGGTLTIQSGATLNYSGSATTLATYDSVAGTFDTELNIPDGFNLEYGANTLKIAPTGGSVFRFR